MKKIVLLMSIFTLIYSCGEDLDDNLTASDEVSVTLKFTHNWDGTPVSNADFNTIQYANANGEMMSIERLRYLISNVVFTKANGGTFTLDGHQLVDVTTNENLEMTLTIDTAGGFSLGDFSNVSFTFGFNNQDNSQNYPDLNSASFNVPEMLGGGYHYMQFDGKFINDLTVEQGFNFHAIRAVDNPGSTPTFPQDTFFTVNLGEVNLPLDNSTIEVKMNIAEWFKNPNTWDLNVLNQMLMPNSAAQIMIYENGQDVFSLGAVTQ